MKNPPVSKVSAAFFLIANVTAGGFHYLFQVVASKKLAIDSFSQFSVWLAYVAMLLAIPSLGQYIANFTPIRNGTLRLLSPFLILFSIAVSVVPFVELGDANLLSGAFSIALGLIFCWLLGQLQNRLMFFTMSIATLMMAISKLLLVVLPIGPMAPVDQFMWAISMCFIPAIVFVGIIAFLGLKKESSTDRGDGFWPRLASPALLAFTSSAIPQYDLAILRITQPSSIFQSFALASLFYKGVFFIGLIFAQWLLPQQIRGLKQGLSLKKLFQFLACGTFLSALFASGAEFLGTVVLKWPLSPPPLIVFLSCANMAVMTALFFQVQEACIAGRKSWGGGLLGALVCAALVQSQLGLSIQVYLSTQLVVHLALAISYIMARNHVLAPQPA